MLQSLLLIKPEPLLKSNEDCFILSPKLERNYRKSARLSLSVFFISNGARNKNKAVELATTDTLSEIVRQRNLGNGRKSKSIIRKSGNEYELFTSGAPEEIFTLCRDISEDIKNGLAEETSKGRRVIAVAYKKIKPQRRKS